ncbi:MAG TPA: zf-HC2 domain-containing protein [Phycisphaerae bacterium]|nr:zf-HC2 domain-containing protein [Phycisphaerae bacterium]
MNRCPDRDQWVLYAAGEVSARRRRALAAHLETCPTCRTECRAVERGLEALTALPAAPAVRPEAIEMLRRRLSVAAAHRVSRPSVVGRVYRYRWVAAAAVLIAAALTYTLFPASDVTQPAWRDESYVVDEITEISAELEMLELNTFAATWDSGNGSGGAVPEAIKGQGRLPLGRLADEVGVQG